MIMICQCRFIISRKGTILVSDVIMGKAEYVGAEVIWETSALSSQFYCTPKTALKTVLTFLLKKIKRDEAIRKKVWKKNLTFSL